MLCALHEPGRSKLKRRGDSTSKVNGGTRDSKQPGASSALRPQVPSCQLRRKRPGLSSTVKRQTKAHHPSWTLLETLTWNPICPPLFARCPSPSFGPFCWAVSSFSWCFGAAPPCFWRGSARILSHTQSELVEFYVGPSNYKLGRGTEDGPFWALSPPFILVCLFLESTLSEFVLFGHERGEPPSQQGLPPRFKCLLT